MKRGFKEGRASMLASMASPMTPSVMLLRSTAKGSGRSRSVDETSRLSTPRSTSKITAQSATERQTGPILSCKSQFGSIFMKPKDFCCWRESGIDRYQVAVSQAAADEAH